MKKSILWLMLIIVLLAACGAPGEALEPMPDVVANEPMDVTEDVVPMEAAASDDATNIQPIPTMTTAPLATPTIVTTDTPFPPLALPSPQPGVSEDQVWDGLPTNPVESLPGRYFRLMYDPQFWALTEDPFGQPALGHRGIPYCVISLAPARGLPMDWRVEHEIRPLGLIYYEISLAYEGEFLRFVTYLGGDGQVFTSFKVEFVDDSEICLRDAEIVLSSLTSIPENEATVIP